MKNYLLLLLVGFIYQCHAQQYLDSTATWYLQGGSSDGVNQYSYHHVDYLDGDTTIGGYRHYKMFEDRDDSAKANNAGNYQPLDTSKHNFIMYLREASQVFYSFHTLDDSDVVLVNFNRHLNDTVWFNNCSEAYAVIKRIDTVYLGSMPRRRFIYDDPNVFLLEGVGTYRGITEGCDGDLFIEGGIYTTCFGQDTHTLSLSLTGGCSVPGFTTPIPPIPYYDMLDVYPNPATNSLSINVGPQMLGATMQIRDVTGRLLVADQLQNRRYQLQTASFASGLYFLQVENNGVKLMKTFVKQ